MSGLGTVRVGRIEGGCTGELVCIVSVGGLSECV